MSRRRVVCKGAKSVAASNHCGEEPVGISINASAFGERVRSSNPLRS